MFFCSKCDNVFYCGVKVGGRCTKLWSWGIRDGYTQCDGIVIDDDYS
jgi:hypothetical protein